jgi:uncharacterized repeat protein (TIGR03803 family)
MKKCTNSACSLRGLSICAFVLLVSSVFVLAEDEQVVYAFGTQTGDGTAPGGGLIADASGNFYGTTGHGGMNRAGTVYELSPTVPPSTSWTETVLYSFSGNADGANPAGGLVFDAAGNLYGTASSGGDASCAIGGCGTVFELRPPTVQGGNWTETTLYAFAGGSDGVGPNPGVVFDQAGNLYGTTNYGGSNGPLCMGPPVSGCGTVFELSPGTMPGYPWTEAILYSFTEGVDGGFPLAPLVLDSAGNLYGTTVSGGSVECDFGPCGTVFEISPSGDGVWTETVIHNFFGGGDGQSPAAGLFLDKSGALVGTTPEGGKHSGGTVFGLLPQGRSWAYGILYSFGKSMNDGEAPRAGVISINGMLYGTTFNGGSNALGTIFQLTRISSGVWKESGLYSFKGGSDGKDPQIAILLLHNGALYGTTGSGGSANGGTVFRIGK